tara:strand:+ start:216 stop:506 length:291 start_codon:yes stop_codon:yes gene_type:complete
MEIANCEALKADGLHYIDEDTGEEKIIPRCNITDEGYKYDQKTSQYKEYLMKECSQRNPKLDKVTIEIFVDDWLNNPERMTAEMEKDEIYMSKFKK